LNEKGAPSPYGYAPASRDTRPDGKSNEEPATDAAAATAMSNISIEIFRMNVCKK
jgi:hypothetical protein